MGSEVIQPLEGTITIQLTTHVHGPSHREALRFLFVFHRKLRVQLWLHPQPPEHTHKKQLLKYWLRLLCSLRMFCNLLHIYVKHQFSAAKKTIRNFNPGQPSGVSPSSGGVDLPSLTQPKNRESATTHQEPTPMKWRNRTKDILSSWLSQFGPSVCWCSINEKQQGRHLRN